MSELLVALNSADPDDLSAAIADVTTPAAADAAQDLIDDRLVELIEDDGISLRQREAAAQALAIRSDAAFQRLLDLAKSDGSNVRGIAAVGLGKSETERSVAVLVDMLTDDTNTVRNLAERSLLGLVGLVRVHQVERLLELLNHDVPLTRSPVARLLGACEDARALPPLVAMLQSDENWLGRMWAAKSLGDLGADGAVDALTTALKADEKNRVRAAAAEAISQLKPPNADELLQEALNDKDAGVRSSAEEGLQTLGFADG
ncbi:MAG: HEAT repeat domain-containing protein [Planctomycetota bacterium]|nr:HEAT repeat domain-containing protein [Planctomycetota bacterium]